MEHQDIFASKDVFPLLEKAVLVSTGHILLYQTGALVGSCHPIENSSSIFLICRLEGKA